MERLRETLKTRSVTVGNIDADRPRRTSRSTACRRRRTPCSATPPPRCQTNFDRSAGTNGTYTFTMRPNIQVDLREESVVQARQTIERRVNELGVTEPSIAQQGSNGDQILVQLPGVTDVNRAKEIIRSTGLLELKIVEQGPSPTKEALMTSGQVPPGMELVPGAGGTPGDAGTVYYLVKKAAAVTGTDLRNARPSVDENNQPAVAFTSSNEGGRKFGKVTQREHRATARDHPRRPRPVGAAHRVAHPERRPHHRQLHDRRSAEPRADPAVGALSASLTYLEERTIGPTLGADSIRAGVARNRRRPPLRQHNKKQRRSKRRDPAKSHHR